MGVQPRDSDNDELLDSDESGVDTDADSVPDYLDGDSDNDGVFDPVDICPLVYDPDQTCAPDGTAVACDAPCPAGRLCDVDEDCAGFEYCDIAGVCRFGLTRTPDSRRPS